MSEPSSLYMRLTLTQDALNNFLQSLLVSPREYNDWLPWLATKSYHGQIDDAFIQAMEMPTGAALQQQSLTITSMLNTPTQAIDPAQSATVEHYLSLFSGNPYLGPTRTQYDPVHNQWMLCIVQCSENFQEYIEILSVLRAGSTYKNLPGDDFIMIYPYLWTEGYVDAYVSLSVNQSLLVSNVPDSSIYEASEALEQLMRDTIPPDNDPLSHQHLR